MGDVLKIGGNFNGTVKGFSANNDGAIFTTRDIKITKIFDEEELRSTDTNRSTVLADLSGGVFVSLRVLNRHDKPVTLRFYKERFETLYANSTYLKDANGNDITWEVPATSGERVITPDDIPVLPYLQYIGLSVKAAEAPTTGDISVWVIVKG